MTGALWQQQQSEDRRAAVAASQLILGAAGVVRGARDSPVHYGINWARWWRQCVQS